jgi:hypothetical protein
MNTLSQSKQDCLKNQTGSVLVIGMIFLVIIMIGAVTIMSSSVQDEQATGNTRRSNDAFMAAEAGVKHSETYLFEETYQGQDYNPPNWFYYGCKEVTIDGEKEYRLVDENGDLFAAEAELISKTDFANGSQYEVLVDGRCVPKDEEGDEEGVKTVKTLHLSSIGYQSTSKREIIYSLGHNGDATWPAVFVNEDPDNPTCDFDFGPAAAYEYDGKGGPAISTNTSTCANKIREDDGGTGQLIGGVIANNPDPDFTSPYGLMRFFMEIERITPSSNKIVGDPDNNPKKDRVVNTNTHPQWKDKDFNVGTPDDPSSMQTTIVYGNLEAQGSIEGAGVLIVTGRADFGGTPHWDGIILVLGGEVNIGGGGTANGLDGTLIVSNIDFGNDKDEDGYLEYDVSKDKSIGHPPCSNSGDCWGFSKVPDTKISWDTSGGGNALYNYGCENLINAAQSLIDAGFATPEYQFPAPTSCPDLDGDGNSGDGSFGTISTVDWFEEVSN